MQLFNIKTATIRAGIASLLCLSAGSVGALNLSDAPLAISTGVDPNIMLLFDTSGSMKKSLSKQKKWGCGRPWRRCPPGPTRLDVVQDAAVRLLNNHITNAHVGLVKFRNAGKEDEGAHVVVGLRAIESSGDVNRQFLIDSINALTGDDSTPLAAALAQVGRYFVQGKNQSLSFSSPNNNVSSPLNAYDLFRNKPSYTNAADKPLSGSPAITESCQKNYVIALTDGAPSGDEDYTNALAKWVDNSINHSDDSIGDFDDIAGALYDIDLRPDFSDYKNNVTTYTIGFDLSSEPDALAMLRRAADLGGGLFVQADDEEALDAAFTSFAASIFSKVSAIAPLAFNSSQLKNGSAVFQAKFDSEKWSGSFSALPLDSDGSLGNPAWEAGNVLSSILPRDRNIYTYDNTASSGAGEGIPFEWGSLNSAQQADLYKGVDRDGDGHSTEGDGNDDLEDGKALLNYIRGERSGEGSTAGNYRVRKNPLGDIINSAPVFVGPPQMNWPDYDANAAVKFGGVRDDYSSFKSSATYANRDPVVYVGANDSMLHGFSASLTSSDKGEEVFAYIPSAVFSSGSNEGLHYLASQQYGHKFYVDATPSVSDVYIPNVSGGSKSWRTVLVGGLRGGGKGIYALDVSKPSLFSKPANNADKVVLWEFNGVDGITGDSDLGNIYSSPTIAMMANGKWAAIFSNGYNSTGGKAKLFIAFLEEGLDGWAGVGDYIELDTGVGSDNGLSSARVVDLDGDSVADLVYAGDLKGNMWKFNVSDATASNWTTTKLFTASDSAGNAQAITTLPMVGINPHHSVISTASNPNVLVMFGTGKFLERADTATRDKMAYYAVWDKGHKNLVRGKLAAREMVSDHASGLRKVNGTAINWNTQYGWYMDLLDITTTGSTGTAEGERVVSESLLRRSVLFFNTMSPEQTACESDGLSWLMSLQYDTGLAPSFAVFDANGDGSINSADVGSIGQKFTLGFASASAILGDKQYTSGSDSADPNSSGSDVDVRDIYVGKGGREGRLSWIEKYRDN